MLIETAQAHGCDACLLMGDLNWNDDNNGDAMACLPPTWRDAFIEAGRPKGEAATCGWSWRFDRVLYHAMPALRDDHDALRVTRFVLAGKEQGPLLQGITFEDERGRKKKVFPSDHKGVVVSFAGRDA